MLIPESHPRASSLKTRELLVNGFEQGIVAQEGLIAHGRGEAFDYLLGEETRQSAKEAVRAAAAALILAEHPVISVNGNAAALCPDEIVSIAGACGALIEVNIFYDRKDKRRQKIASRLGECGANDILGVDSESLRMFPGGESARFLVDGRGILQADAVLLFIEDGDRCKALTDSGKTAIAFDLNPLSRTARSANITIVDNVVRSAKLLAAQCSLLASAEKDALRRIVKEYDNRAALADAEERIRAGRDHS